MAKKWIGKAIKRPGRVKNAAKRAGISTHAMAEKMSHSSDPSARGAGNLALRFQKGSLHGGGTAHGDPIRSQEAAQSLTENENQKHNITGASEHAQAGELHRRTVKQSAVAERHVI
jgi:hypothetical protein